MIIGGGIDLSVPWTLNCAAVLLTALARGQDGPLIWIIPLILAGGVLIGVINGVGIAIFRVPPIVMTLSMNIVLQGVLFIATSGFPPPPTPESVVWLATGRLGPVPVILVIWAILTIAILFVERRTSFGRYLYAVGTNRMVATFSGVPVARTTIATYAISGAAAALAGILLDGYARQSYLGMGDPFLFTSIAAVAIGGASILGGTGSYLGTIAGALILTVLAGLLPILQLDSAGESAHRRSPGPAPGGPRRWRGPVRVRVCLWRSGNRARARPPISAACPRCWGVLSLTQLNACLSDEGLANIEGPSNTRR